MIKFDIEYYYTAVYNVVKISSTTTNSTVVTVKH